VPTALTGFTSYERTPNIFDQKARENFKIWGFIALFFTAVIMTMKLKRMR
jgi:hypothetical protein